MEKSGQVDHVSTVVNSPVGELTLIASPFGLAAILWENDKPGRVRLNVTSQDAGHAILMQTASELGEYFRRERQVFDVPLDFVGTDFQKEVWRALRDIPFGETRTYGQIAREIGSPKAVRAVGAANGRNPVSIIMPCHRVIGSTGSLTGFAGGLDRKLLLLELEKEKRASRQHWQLQLI